MRHRVGCVGFDGAWVACCNRLEQRRRRGTACLDVRGSKQLKSSPLVEARRMVRALLNELVRTSDGFSVAQRIRLVVQPDEYHQH